MKKRKAIPQYVRIKIDTVEKIEEIQEKLQNIEKAKLKQRPYEANGIYNYLLKEALKDFDIDKYVEQLKDLSETSIQQYKSRFKRKDI